MKQMIQPPLVNEPETLTSVRPELGSVSASSGFDLVKIKQYVHIIIRRIWIVALCFTVAMVLSVLKVSKQEAVYSSSTSMLLSRGTQLPGQYSAGQEQDFFGDFIDTQVRIINSRAVVGRAKELLNFPQQEISRLLRTISASPIGRSSLILISVQSLDPQFSADFANAIASAYVEFKAEERVTGTQTAAVNLTQQANKIREELKKAEEALILFKRENDYVAQLNEGNIAGKIISDVAQRAAAFKLERMILEMQRPLLSDASDDVILTALGSRYVPVASEKIVSDRPQSARGEKKEEATDGIAHVGMVDFEGANNTSWNDLKKKKSGLEQQLRVARENLRDNHPSVRKLIQEIKALDEALDLEVQFATEKYYAQLEALTIKESSLTRVQSMWQEEAMESELTIDRHEGYQNDIDRLKNLLDAVFSRVREIDITSGIIPDNVTIIERALPGGYPVNPRKMQSIFLAGLIGIAVGIGIIFGLEFLDDSIRYPEDVEKMLGLGFLGVVPAATWNEGDIRTHLLSQIDPKSGLSESYRNIRATLLLADRTRRIKSILLTSSVPKEGKTTTSLNVSISFAQAGLRVLLVDADMRRGEIHKYFGLEGGRGLSDVLSGQAKTESVIQRTGVPNLDVVATGPFPVNPAELLLRNEFRSFIDYAKRSYDKIIFDGPPVMAVSEAAVLASFVDSTLLVVWAGKTSKKLCQLTVQNLRQRGALIDGCILNNLEFGRVGYYYYSTYYSYYNYDYRYDEKTRGV